MPGHKRSRALWDEARRPAAPRSAFLRAVLYELQPLRLSSIDFGALFAWLASTRRRVGRFVMETLPALSHGVFRLARGMSVRSWCICFAIVAYYYAICYIHRALDAGPIAMILTALVAIFTVGLGDNEDGLSAYSVFNRGFQRLLGDLDADALVQQHVAGGAMALGMGMPLAPPREENDRPIMAPRQHEEPVARFPDGDDNQEEMLDGQGGQRPQLGRARRSGKKARRRDTEQRRELQRQRQAAIDMGFTGDGGREEMMAMQRLLEEQIAENANHDIDRDGQDHLPDL